MKFLTENKILYVTIFLGSIFKILKGGVLAEVHSSAPGDYDLLVGQRERKTRLV